MALVGERVGVKGGRCRDDHAPRVGAQGASREASSEAGLAGQPRQEEVLEVLVERVLHEALSFGGGCGFGSDGDDGAASPGDAARARASAAAWFFCAIRPSAAS